MPLRTAESYAASRSVLTGRERWRMVSINDSVLLVLMGMLYFFAAILVVHSRTGENAVQLPSMPSAVLHGQTKAASG